MPRNRNSDGNRNQAADAAAACVVAAMVGCCQLAHNNIKSIGESIREGRNCSAFFKAIIILAGTGVAIWAAVNASAPMYNGLVQNIEAEEGLKRATAGLGTAIADTFIVTGGFNIAGWMDRGICDFFKKGPQPTVRLPPPSVNLDAVVVTRPGLSS